MKIILAVVSVLLLAASAQAQYVTTEQCQQDAIGWVAVPAQCGNDCPPSCGPGGCYPVAPPPQRYAPVPPPQRQAPPRQPAQPEPKYEVRPQKPLPSVQPVTPAMPAPTTPTQPCPTIDVDALKRHEQAIKDALAQQLKVDQSILVAIKEQPRCNCQPTDLTQINAKIDALSKAVAVLKLSPPAPAPAASGKPAFYIDVRPHKEN